MNRTADSNLIIDSSSVIFDVNADWGPSGDPDLASRRGSKAKKAELRVRFHRSKDMASMEVFIGRIPPGVGTGQQNGTKQLFGLSFLEGVAEISDLLASASAATCVGRWPKRKQQRSHTEPRTFAFWMARAARLPCRPYPWGPMCSAFGLLGVCSSCQVRGFRQCGLRPARNCRAERLPDAWRSEFEFGFGHLCTMLVVGL